MRDHGLDESEKATRSLLEARGGSLVNRYLGFEDGLRHYVVFDVPDEATAHAGLLNVAGGPIYDRAGQQLVRLISVDEAREAARKIKEWPTLTPPPEMPGSQRP